jgi:hypothetical protein
VGKAFCDGPCSGLPYCGMVFQEALGTGVIITK